MEKSLKITPPDGYEIDKEKSTFDEVVFKKINKISYETIIKERYYPPFMPEVSQVALHIENRVGYTEAADFNFVTKDQLRKLCAINKLLVVAKYLNNDNSFTPIYDKINLEKSYAIAIAGDNVYSYSAGTAKFEVVRFKTEQLAQQAIEILGEETIKMALSTDY